MNDKDVIKETKPRMESAIEDFKRKLATVRTGRASVSLLDTVSVDYYGTPTPLNQMASVHAPEPQNAASNWRSRFTKSPKSIAPQFATSVAMKMTS
jgi:ribosome recycling factor